MRFVCRSAAACQEVACPWCAAAAAAIRWQRRKELRPGDVSHAAGWANPNISTSSSWSPGSSWGTQALLLCIPACKQPRAPLHAPLLPSLPSCPAPPPAPRSLPVLIRPFLAHRFVNGVAHTGTHTTHPHPPRPPPPQLTDHATPFQPLHAHDHGRYVDQEELILVGVVGSHTLIHVQSLPLLQRRPQCTCSSSCASRRRMAAGQPIL